MDRLHPRNRSVFSGFTNSEIEKMEKVLRETKGQSLTQDFYQKLTKSFNYSSGRAGKPLVKWTEIESWFQTRLQDSLQAPENELVSLQGLQCKQGETVRDPSELEFEARSSKDEACHLTIEKTRCQKIASEITSTSKPSALEAPPSISVSETFTVHLICGLSLALAFWISNSLYSIDLVTDPSLTLFIISIIELPIVILIYSRYRQNHQQCSYLRAVGRGILGVPVGALLNSLGAIALGAPVTFQCLPKTLVWSLMMSLFTTVPASCVLGSSWADWKRIFAHTKTNGSIEYLICLQAHGAVIGGWFGAWPMPLDWERPWQEWPISVSYGTFTGYLVASLGFILAHRNRLQHIKNE